MKVASTSLSREVSVTSKTALRADGHVHIYPEFNIELIWEAMARNLSRPDLSRAIFLTERCGYNFFAGFAGRGPSPEVTETSGGWVFAGKQVATRERLEVLALCCRGSFEEGLPVEETLAQVRAAGAVPVIPWSPGKWMFSRGALLHRLLDQAQPGDFLLADSSLRPLCWPEPSLLRVARKRGFGIIAGTDPFPFSGQEQIIGTFGFQLNSGFNSADPVSSVREALLRPSPDVEIFGRRGTPFSVAVRLYRNSCAKK